MNFAANWICRADPESPVGNRVLLITPNDVLPTVAVRPGWPRFAWLNRLKTSTRSCTRAAPDSVTFLMSDRSVSPNPGPMIEFLERFPKCATPLAEYGSAYTELELHEPAAGAAMRGSQTVLLANHW